MSFFYVALATAAISAVGAISAGQQQKQAMDQQAAVIDYNNTIDKANAEQTSKVAGIQEDEQRRRARATVGTQIAASGEAGAGLNSDLLRQSIFDSEQDALNIRYQGQLKSAGLNDQAAIGQVNASTTRTKGSNASTAGYLNAAGSLLSSAGSYYSYNNPRLKAS